MNKLINMDEKLKLITTNLSEPTGYGRILKNSEKFEKIVEQKDCNKRELEIKEINCGIYAIKSEYLCKYLPHLKNNNSQGEYYLTDIIEMIKREEGLDVGILKIPQENVYEILGVNTIEQLKELEKLIIKNKIETKTNEKNSDI
jgi:bifunctional UDP-N-acetylglucosamine pyrophosphorylase/glucosamine-1-phosphate N-acetyltransferase